MIQTWAHRNKTKLPTPWTFNIPKRYKKNTIKSELYEATRISSNLTSEIILIKYNFKLAGYPMRFLNSVIHEFTTGLANEDKKRIIPHWFFEVKTKIFFVEITYCLKNESLSKQFVKKFDEFTDDKFDVR